MNVFNRLLTILLLLSLLILALLFAISPDQVISAIVRMLENVQTWLAGVATSYRWLYILGRILLFLVALAVIVPLLIAELRRPRPKTLVVQTEAGSRATVAVDSLSRRLIWHIDQLSDVISVTPKVTPRGKAVDVLLEVETSPETDVPMKADEIVAVAREVIEDRMGMQAGNIKVQISHSPYQDQGAV